MNAAILTATISVIGALAVAAVTCLFTKMREHEADWRKMKLEHYREYVAALSGIVHSGAGPQAQTRYSDAVNSLTLVASPEVLNALYAFQDEISYRNKNRDQRRHDERLSALLRCMRRDVQPRRPNDVDGFLFRFLDVPPKQ